jgi:hypothetical protein
MKSSKASTHEEHEEDNGLHAEHGKIAATAGPA